MAVISSNHEAVTALMQALGIGELKVYDLKISITPQDVVRVTVGFFLEDHQVGRFTRVLQQYGLKVEEWGEQRKDAEGNEHPWFDIIGADQIDLHRLLNRDE